MAKGGREPGVHGVVLRAGRDRAAAAAGCSAEEGTAEHPFFGALVLCPCDQRPVSVPVLTCPVSVPVVSVPVVPVPVLAGMVLFSIVTRWR